LRRFSLTPPRGRSRLLAAASGALAALSIAAAPAVAGGSSVPDPLAPGPHPAKKIDYEVGKLLLTLPDGLSTTPVPLRGSITYPEDAVSAPIVLFDHGRHTACIGGPVDPNQRICDDTYDADGNPIETDVRSYAGYDYMAKNLASHGYVVMSVETNTANFDNGWRDGGANARSQIIQANLELLYRWHKGAGPVVPGEPDESIGTKLTGKLDFANPIGMMGHSRGGDAVTDFIGYTRNLRPRSGFPRMNLGAVLALAPVNYTAYKMPYGTNYGVILPACDGDVSTLQGARFFENAKYPTDATGQTTDTFAKVQWYVQGTNHNFYNTVWSADDFSRSDDPACSRSAETTARLTTPDQRRVGAALMNSFFRRYVGGEKAFEPIMTGEVTLPESAAPLASGKGLREQVKTSYVAPAAKRFDVLRPKAIPDPQPDPLVAPPTPFDPTLTTTTAGGGWIEARGLTTFQVCNPNDVAYRQGPTYPTAYPTCPEGALNRSKGNQYTLAWNGPATLEASLARYAAPVDVSRFGALHLRASINRNDPRNPAGDGYTPDKVTQDFTITLKDAAGNRATTRAARWSTALEPSIGTAYQHITLNGIRVPLGAFAGVDLTTVTTVELGFGRRTPTGSIQLADLMFQESPASAAATPDGESYTDDPDPVFPGPDGPPSVLPGPIVDAPVPVADAPAPKAAGGTAELCFDTAKPSVKVKKVAVGGKQLVVTGTAADLGCAGGTGAAAGGVEKTLVQVFRLSGKRAARFATARGTLSKPLPRALGIAIAAKGTGSWKVALPTAKLPRGAYRIRVSTFDRSGNLTVLGVRTAIVKR
jgi:hypothetical protein